MLKDSFAIDPTASLAMQVRDVAKPIPSTDYIAMKYIEKKLAELESGEFWVEPVTPDTLLPHGDGRGTLSLKEGGSKTTMLACPEQLRLCLTVLQNALIMIQLRHPSRHEPSDVNMLEKYKEYLLQVGDYCYALCSSEESGSLVPPWDLVLSYEHAIERPSKKLKMHQKGAGKGKGGNA
ncbi:hypothetical protein AK812_SmicGene38249 [Symbiodinium microadriaticum]|uniref:Uncharacterized protein n=1 Tax=Symbiodinium microadriaticum TaxID=2951 RepID=A0A1Q9CE90_SYMMI|nr:hypothetical protein AK812_SmicGene38249 [Symbiodinium microadriaticum]